MTILRTHVAVLAVAVLSLSTSGRAQSDRPSRAPALAPIAVPMTAERWQTKENAEFLRQLGFYRGLMRLNSGNAVLKDTTFSDGTIEFDVNTIDPAHRGSLPAAEQQKLRLSPPPHPPPPLPPPHPPDHLLLSIFPNPNAAPLRRTDRITSDGRLPPQMNVSLTIPVADAGSPQAEYTVTPPAAPGPTPNFHSRYCPPSTPAPTRTPRAAHSPSLLFPSPPLQRQASPPPPRPNEPLTRTNPPLPRLSPPG